MLTGLHLDKMLTAAHNCASPLLEDGMSDDVKTATEIGSLGGKATAAKMTPEERKERARLAAQARWHSDVPVATHTGDLKIGDLEIPCAVLQDGTRLLSETGVVNALGLYRSGAVQTREKE